MARASTSSTISAVSLMGSLCFGMQIENVWKDASRVVVETTGAIYELTEGGLEMTRKIDPATNTVNPERWPVYSLALGRGALISFLPTARSACCAVRRSSAASMPIRWSS